MYPAKKLFQNSAKVSTKKQYQNPQQSSQKPSQALPKPTFEERCITNASPNPFFGPFGRFLMKFWKPWRPKSYQHAARQNHKKTASKAGIIQIQNWTSTSTSTSTTTVTTSRLTQPSASLSTWASKSTSVSTFTWTSTLMSMSTLMSTVSQVDLDGYVHLDVDVSAFAL